MSTGQDYRDPVLLGGTAMLELFERSVQELHGVGQKRAQLYGKLGIATIGELLHLFPRSYIDVTNPIPVPQTVIGEPAAVRVRVYKKARGTAHPKRTELV